MIKELKNLFFILIITLFIFLTLKYYFSNDNKKNSYRSLKTIDEKNLTFSQNLILLGDNTNDAVEYVKNTIDKNKKNYNFWKLIKNND
ncbi:hypothetical protein OAL81_03935 [Candidatus Pelagibacter sp.]|jgi:hypothetical protein|nr:hypothetical protein [Candidatus Pelagibacter sp.]|tara:strand:+ start:74 stop:337 length:264 start_codon:yes stop_codon:yes gene_type:complete